MPSDWAASISISRTTSNTVEDYVSIVIDGPHKIRITLPLDSFARAVTSQGHIACRWETLGPRAADAEGGRAHG